MSEFLYKVLVSTDFLGEHLNFYVNGSYKYKTLFGGVLSILIVFGVVILTCYFGQDVYYKEKPKVLSSSTLLPQFPTMDVDPSSFNIAFRLENIDGEVIDDKRFIDFRFILYNYTIDLISGIVLSKEMSIRTPEKCSEALVPKNIEGYEKILNTYYCVNNTFTVGGDWDSTFLLQPSYIVNLCDKETESKYNVTCSDPEEFFKKYQNIYLDIFILKSLLNLNNEPNPLQKTFEYHYFPILNQKTTRNIHLKYSKANVSTDEGIIFEEYNNRTFLDFDSIQLEDESLVDGALVKTSLFLIKKHKNYTRIYIKVPEVLAIVGGFMNTILTCINAVYFPVWDNDLWHYLQSKLYKLELEIDRNDDIVENSKNKIELSKTVHNSLSPIHPVYKKVTINKAAFLNKDLKNYVEREKGRKKKVEVSKWWRFCFFKMFTCEGMRTGTGSKEKYEMLDAADREFLKKIEILNLFKNFDNLAVLKKVILNQAQSIMIEKRGAKSISCNSKEIFDKNLDEIYSKKQKEKIDIVRKYLKSTKLNDVDYLLYSQIDDTFLEAVNKEEEGSIIP